MSSEFVILGWKVQPDRNCLVRGGREVKLEPKAMKVLVHLAERPSEVATKQSIFTSVWAGRHVSEEVLTNCIWELRRAFGDSAKSPRFIETVPKSGYRLIPPVERLDRPRESSRAGGAPTKPRPLLPASLAAGIAVLVAAGVVGLWMPASDRDGLAIDAEASPIRSLAVLPLRNLSGDPQQEYIATAITAALVGELGKLGSLHVISHTSVIQYEDSEKPVPEIARELNVEGIIEGAVLRDGDRVRITAQLIDARHDRQLWSQRYDREFSDVLALQSDVARAVAEQVRLELSPEERAALKASRSVHPRAVDAYLRGLQLLQSRRPGPGGMKPPPPPAAIEQFERAVKADPDFAEAHYRLAGAHIRAAVAMRSEGRHEEFAKAREAAQKALELDDSLGGAYASLGDISLHEDWDFPEAGRAYERALALSPNDPDVLSINAWYLLLMGRAEEALDCSERLLIVAPFDRYYRAKRPRHLIYARRYESAIVEFDRMRNLWPNYEDLWEPAAYYALGRLEEGYRAEFAYYESCGAPCDWASGAWVSGWKEGGRVGAYRAWLAAALQRKEGLTPNHIARGYAVIGDVDEAFAWLERGYSDRDGSLLMLMVDPAWDPLRHDPRFVDLLRRIGFPN